MAGMRSAYKEELGRELIKYEADAASWARLPATHLRNG